MMHIHMNPLRTTGRLVKMNALSIFKPIRDIVRMVLNCVIHLVVNLNIQEKCIMIGYQNTNVMLLTN